MTEYQKFLKHISTMKAGLLGEFDKDDKYVIPQDVVQQLVKSKKLLTSYKENEALCEAYFAALKYNFIIKFFDNKEDNKKYSSLYIQEQYTYLGKKINLETFLVNFSEINDNGYFNKLKEALVLFTKDESEGKDIKNSDEVIGKIVKTKKTKSKILNKELMANNRKYIYDVISALKKQGKLGADVQKKLKEKLANLQKNKNDPEYWAMVKEILDQILEEKNEEISEEFRKWLELVNQNYINLYMAKEKNIKLDAKPAKKPAAKKSKAAAKKKKKDDDDKKDDKKTNKTTNKQPTTPLKKDDKQTASIAKPIIKEENKPEVETIFNDKKAYRYLVDYLKNSKDYNEAIAEANAKIADQVFIEEIEKITTKKPLTEQHENSESITITVSMQELETSQSVTKDDERTL